MISKEKSDELQWEMRFLLLIFRLSKTTSGHFSLFSSYRNNIVFLMPIVSCGGTRTEDVLSLEVLGTLAYACLTGLMLQQQGNISSMLSNIILLSIRGVGLQFVCRGELRCWFLMSRAFFHALSWTSTSTTEITWDSDIPGLVLNCGICCSCCSSGIQDCWPSGLAVRPISSLRQKRII